jgi:hypothetical protein
MLKTLIPVDCLLATCGARMSAAADLHFAEKLGGVSHDLRIANLKGDARGVPSFDHTYRQQPSRRVRLHPICLNAYRS